MKTADTTAKLATSMSEVAFRWPMRIPAAFERRIPPGDTEGPIARQVVPRLEELRDVVGFCDDPVGDQSAECGDGLLVKYNGRALLLATSLCAVHCRYCFRREYRRIAPEATVATRRAALERLSHMTDVNEVILSGGDPLMLPNGRLTALLSALDAMPHITRIRFHTRMATAVPERIDDHFCDLLKNTVKSVIVVTHVNHADELDDETAEALAKLRSSGVLLLNQSVLLRRVNDTPDALAALSEKLTEQGVLPYYLHQLDRVKGASHFEVPVEEGRRLIAALRELCPGYMVPRYVVEVPGAPSKVPIL